MKFIYIVTLTVLLGVAVGAPIPGKDEKKKGKSKRMEVAAQREMGVKARMAKYDLKSLEHHVPQPRKRNLVDNNNPSTSYSDKPPDGQPPAEGQSGFRLIAPNPQGSLEPSSSSTGWQPPAAGETQDASSELPHSSDPKISVRFAADEKQRPKGKSWKERERGIQLMESSGLAPPSKRRKVAPKGQEPEGQEPATSSRTRFGDT